MKRKHIEQMAKELVGIAKCAITDFQALESPHKIISSEGIAFALTGQTVTTYNELVRRLLNIAKLGEKYSEKSLELRLNSIIASFLGNSDAQSVKTGLNELFQDFEDLATEVTVYVPVFGLSVPEPCAFGRVLFRVVDESTLDNLVSSVSEVITQTRNTEPEKTMISERMTKSITENLRGTVCSTYKVVAEPQRARELAEIETRRAFDLLRFAVPFLYRGSENIRIGLLGEITRKRTVSLAYSGSNYSLFHHLVGPVETLALTPSNIDRMAQIGVLALSDILKKDEATHTEYERVILRSVHWIAGATVQTENENTFLNLMTSLETLLTPRDSSPIGTAIAEGVALLLGKTLEQRKHIKQRIKHFYGQRGGVSHGGEKAILESECWELRQYATLLISALVKRVDDFKNHRDLFDWLENKKLG